MISEGFDTFPNNVINVVKDNLKLIDADVPVFKRPIQKGDPVQCIGITAASWIPDDSSNEMTGMGGRHGPTVSNYLIYVQLFVQDMDQERGYNVISQFTNIVRARLSMDPTLRVQLGSLQSDVMGYVERFKRLKITEINYVSNEIDGFFLFLTGIYIQVETETV